MHVKSAPNNLLYLRNHLIKSQCDEIITCIFGLKNGHCLFTNPFPCEYSTCRLEIENKQIPTRSFCAIRFILMMLSPATRRLFRLLVAAALRTEQLHSSKTHNSIRLHNNEQ